MNNLRCLRTNANLSQKKLAIKLGVTQQAVAKWETGEALPRTEKLPELAENLKCEISDLFDTKKA